MRKSLVTLLAVVFSLAFLVKVATADEKSNQKLIVGKWKVSELPPGAPKGTSMSMEIKKGGKVTVKMKFPKDFLDTIPAETQKKLKIKNGVMTVNGSYELKGEKITLTMKNPMSGEQSDESEITKLDEKELILKGKQTIKFKRVKGKE